MIGPVPKPKDQAVPRPLQIVCFREASPAWTRTRLTHLTKRALRNPALEVIEARRRALATMPPLRLHESYAGKNDHAGQPFVTPKTISLPRLYGRILYSVATDSRAQFTLEAGAGLGISGMYLGTAAALLRTSRLVSFEISEYSAIARASIALVFDRAEVHQDEFENFARHLDFGTSVDLCFLDSKHDEATILRDYKSVLGWMSSSCVLVIDDVMSTPESQRAWAAIVRRQDFPFAACIQNRLGFLAR